MAGGSVHAMTWLRGLGLLAVLGVVAIMALMSWRILSDTGGGDVQIVRGEPGSIAPPVDEPVDPSAGAASAADAAACETDRSTVETAAQAYEIQHGTRPLDVQALVDAGYLPPEVALRVTIAPDGTVVPTGTCAGG